MTCYNLALTRVYYIYSGPGGGGWGLDTRVPGHPDAVLSVPVPQPAGLCPPVLHPRVHQQSGRHPISIQYCGPRCHHTN